jgi:glycosyltransferase involved in cell wall biosynthesis
MDTHKQLHVSLVIPAYNEERYLKAVLDSVAAQTTMPNEVIVVDNNSTDGTAAVAKSYHFVRLIAETQQGIGPARHTGFLSAKSELIATIDADTLLEPNWVETVIQYFSVHDEVAAITGKCYFYDFPMKRLLSALQTFAYEYLQGIISGTTTLWGSNMVIRKSVWDDVIANQPIPVINEDIDMSLKIHRAGFSIKRLPNLVAHVSLLRGHRSLKRIYNYLRPWPQTYVNNGMRIKSCLIWILKNVVFITGLLMMPLRYLTLKDKSN